MFQMPFPNSGSLKEGGSSKSAPYFTHGLLVTRRHTTCFVTWMSVVSPPPPTPPCLLPSQADWVSDKSPSSQPHYGHLPTI